MPKLPIIKTDNVKIRVNVKSAVKAAPRTSSTPSVDPRYAAAIARGVIAKKKMASAEGGAISPARAAQVRLTRHLNPRFILKRVANHIENCPDATPILSLNVL